FFSSRRRHTSSKRDWSSDVCSSDLVEHAGGKDAQRSSCKPSRNFFYQLCCPHTDFVGRDELTERSRRHISKYGDTVGGHLLQTFGFFIRQAELGNTRVQDKSTGGQTYWQLS